jgi:hypothetical protein
MIKHLITDPEEFALRYLICCGSGGRDDGDRFNKPRAGAAGRFIG